MSLSISSSNYTRQSESAAHIGELYIIALAWLILEVVLFVTTQRSTSELRYFSPLYLPRLEESVIEAQVKRIGKLSPDSNYDLIVAGDSSAMVGVNPSTIETNSQLRTLNIGTVVWFGVDTHAELVAGVLAKGIKPKAVIYHCSLTALTMSEKSVESLGYRTRYRHWIRMQNGSYFPPSGLMRHRSLTELLPGILKIDRRGESRGAYPSDLATQQELFSSGWFQDHTRRKINRPEILSFSPHAARNLKALAETLNKNGIKLFLVVEPFPKELLDESLGNQLDRLESELYRELGDSWRERLLLPFVRSYPLELIANDSHLTPIGAEQNSNEIVSALRERIRTSQLATL